MIVLPRRSVTRFFIPLIDVLILLFCIFLLMPFVSSPPAEAEKATKSETAPANLPTNVKNLQRELAEARKRLDRLQHQRNSFAERLSVRVLEIDKSNGSLYYFDPDRREIRDQADALRLIDRQRRLAGAKDLFFLILYPRELSGFPLQSQIDAYQRWFKDAPHGFDNPYAN